MDMAMRHALNSYMKLTTGFQLTIGSGQPDAISYTTEFKVSAGIYSWAWKFGG